MMYNPLNKLNKWLAAGLLALSCQYVYADPLVGGWQHNGQPTSIRPSYNHKMLFCNEQGTCAEGRYRGPSVIFVPAWNVTGVVSRNRNVIAWSNGTQWARFNMPPRNEVRVQIGASTAIAGPWLHEGKAASIQMQGDGIHFTIINEFGQPTQGYLNGNRELVIPSLNVSGRLRQQGRIIQWTNGTSWNRP